MSDPICVCMGHGQRMPTKSNRSSVRSIAIPFDLHARVGSAKPNVTIRVWIQPTENAVFSGARWPGSLAKGDKGCPPPKLPPLLTRAIFRPRGGHAEGTVDPS